MNYVNKSSMNIKILPLTKKLAEKYVDDICESLDQIPLVDPHRPEKILAESKADRVFHKKWDHSFIALDNDKFVGVIIGYERDAEGNEQYPYNSIYLSDLAVSSNYQKMGIGKKLVKEWLEKNRKKGFLELNGDLRFSVQTNEAEFNIHVQKLYESFGFKKISAKSYGNRVDNVYFML